jgi:transposase
LSKKKEKDMSMKPHELEPIPENTKRVALKALRKGTLIMRLRETLGTIYHDEDFRDLFPRRGKPAEAPWRLALITVMQALENLTDRQAAQMVQTRIDWKYALSLSLDDEGFDFSVLSAFRDRLLSANVTEKVLEPILTICRREGWLKVNQQRTDSTHILATVRDLSRTECVGETLRAALNDLAQVAPDWLLQVVDPSWFERYVHRIDMYRVSKNVKKQEQWRDQMGEDAWTLLQASRAPEAPAWLQDEASIQLLQQVWDQHFERRGNQIMWRAGPVVSNAEQILSPYETQARAGCKRETQWTGYKCHITETCSREPEHLSVIVQVETTTALVADVNALPPILQDEHARGLDSQEHWVDQGYMSAEQIVAQRKMNRELIGPVGLAQGWQNRVEGGLTAEAFMLDREHHVATCPQGKTSVSWRAKVDSHGKDVEEIRFSIKDCRECPLRERCSRGQHVGRLLSLLPVEQGAVLQERRAEQETEAYRQTYALRSGIEATMSQAVRTTGLRQSPYRGQNKTHLHHVVIAAALNLVRIDQKLLRDQGLGARPRPPSPFQKLEGRMKSCSNI